MSVEIQYVVARPPDDRVGHVKLSEISWHGQLGLCPEDIFEYQLSVKVRDNKGIKAAAEFLEGRGWRVSWSWSGVHGD